jgi:hypothetical protein
VYNLLISWLFHSFNKKLPLYSKGERQFVLGIADVVLGVDDDLLAVLQELVDDDGLIRHLAGNAISAKKIDRIEDIRLNVLAQLFQSGPIHLSPGVTVVNVLLDEHVTAGRDLPLQLRDLGLDRSFRAYPVNT